MVLTRYSLEHFVSDMQELVASQPDQAKRAGALRELDTAGCEVILVEDTTGKGHLSQAVEGKLRHSIFMPVE
jgi:hypothetical protein